MMILMIDNVSEDDDIDYDDSDDDDSADDDSDDDDDSDSDDAGFRTFVKDCILIPKLQHYLKLKISG